MITSSADFYYFAPKPVYLSYNQAYVWGDTTREKGEFRVIIRIAAGFVNYCLSRGPSADNSFGLCIIRLISNAITMV